MANVLQGDLGVSLRRTTQDADDRDGFKVSFVLGGWRWPSPCASTAACSSAVKKNGPWDYLQCFDAGTAVPSWPQISLILLPSADLRR
jgi:hypothetical protein